jgi:hypothetical protein
VNWEIGFKPAEMVRDEHDDCFEARIAETHRRDARLSRWIDFLRLPLITKLFAGEHAVLCQRTVFVFDSTGGFL